MSNVSVNPPKTPVTEGSSGVAAATLPNVCKMPGPPAPFVPTPLPNIGKSGTDPKKYSKSVTIEGKKVAIKGATFGSMGDVASKGTGGGIVSANVEGPTSFIGPGSMDTKIEGKNVQLLGDPMLNNCGPSGSPANAATMMGVVQKNGMLAVVTGDDRCPLCRKRHGDDGALKETPATKVSAARLAQKVARRVRSKEIPTPPPLATMLGVVQCKCKKAHYADQSGMTLQGVRNSVTELGWHAAEASDAASTTRMGIRSFIEKRSPQHVARARKTWKLAAELAAKSKRGETSSAAYPPGACAGPKALVLALEHGAHPGGLTERWFHSDKNPVDAKIKYREGESGEEIEAHFDHGKTVPPCETCNLMIPMIICPEGKELECQHKS